MAYLYAYLLSSWNEYAFGPLCFEIRSEDAAYPGLGMIAEAMGCAAELTEAELAFR